MKVFMLCALVALSCAQDNPPAFDLQTTFNLADADRNGLISKAELDALFTTFDDDANGEISSSEFVAHFTKTGLSSEASLYLFFRIDTDGNQSLNTAEVDALFPLFDLNGDQGVSLGEFSTVMNQLLGQLKIAAAGEASVDAMLDAADDGDGELTGNELWAVISGADTDGDGLVSKSEFTTYWMTKTGDNMDRSARLFGKIEGSTNTPFGQDAEKKALFAAFDYDKSGSVSKTEFKNSLLYMFAKVMDDISNEAMAAAMSPNFDAQKSFDSADTDMNGAITEQEANAAMKSADTDGDGSLNATEFVTAAMKKGFSKVAAVYMLFGADHNSDNMVDANEHHMGFHHKDRNMDHKISFDEYKQAVDMAMHKISRGVGVDDKLSTMFDVVDTEGDEMLTGAELFNVLAPADSNGDGTVAKAEFVAYWPMMTGLSDKFSEHEFALIDSNMNGMIDPEERTGLFVAFDHNNDSMVSKTEFTHAMQRVFVDTLGNIMMEIKGKLKGNFNATVSFSSGDTNGDGAIQKSEYENNYKKIDTDGDGDVSIDEFLVAEAQTGLSTQGALYAFFRLDGNKDNKLVTQEVSDNFDRVDMDDNTEISMSEYMTFAKMFLHELSEASMAGHKTAKLFGMADMDMSGNLTSTEMASIFVAADADKDGLVSAAEFKTFWMSKTGEPAERTDLLFDILDSDNDGQFGNDMERQSLFDGFDYNDDNVVTEDEFQNSLLNLFARVMEEVETRIAAAKAADTVIGFFF